MNEHVIHNIRLGLCLALALGWGTFTSYYHQTHLTNFLVGVGIGIIAPFKGGN